DVYKRQTYPQPHPPFEHAVTVLDVLFHLGPEAPEAIWGWRQRAR
ncbi:WbqC family protein, partial [Myxococcus sp. CA039A]